MFNKKAQLYCITHKQTGKKYIGISYGKNTSYLRRFEEHMNCKGSVYIRKLLKNGSTRDDFYVDLLEEGNLMYIRDREVLLSRYNLYPNGLNGNVGKYIVQTPDVLKKAQDKRNTKMLETKKKISKSLNEWYRKHPPKNGDIKEFKTECAYCGIKLTVKMREGLFYNRKHYCSDKCLMLYRNMMVSTSNKNRTISQDTKDKCSKNIKKYINSLTDNEKKSRLEKSLWSCDHKKRGESISKGKRGKKTNQIKIMKQKYKNMSNREFDKWCEGRLEWVIQRAERLRYSE
jgi:hypothetical protein